MFATKQNLKTTLLHGPAELSKTFLYEAAIYWAEEGRRVFYITPIPLQQIPSSCHESNPSTYFTYKLITFVYLSDYKSLVTQLAELHTFISLPTIVLLDDIDHYIEDDAIKKPDYCEEKTKMRIARACSVIFDAINSCSRISNTIVSNSIHSHNEFHGSITGSFIFLELAAGKREVIGSVCRTVRRTSLEAGRHAGRHAGKQTGGQTGQDRPG
ncbi:hypothetical protein HZH68_007960 [Vespula germanica]|uniref:ATPase AAA-type core domain-containing protein n=1 Tax=Vespula germanica TaxID=30212 RepID=A0A834K339_VESGE|nr:hypothetical protein HZH68_007960 [Vespula germanica]